MYYKSSTIPISNMKGGEDTTKNKYLDTDAMNSQKIGHSVEGSTIFTPLPNIPKTSLTDTEKLSSTITKLNLEDARESSRNFNPVFVFLITLIFGLLIAGLNVRFKLNSLRKDWPKYRCNPLYTPFAGFVINDPNKSKLDQANETFYFCTAGVLEKIAAKSFTPYFSISSIMGAALSIVTGALQSFKTIINTFKMAGIMNFGVLSNYITKLLTPIRHVISVLIDFFTRLVGSLSVIVHTNNTVVAFIVSVFRNVITIMIAILVAVAILMLSIFFIPFIGIPMGLALYAAAFTPIAVILGVIIAGLAGIISTGSASIPKAPSAPSCFDKNTKIPIRVPSSSSSNPSNPLKSYTIQYKSISDINIDDILQNGARVTGVFKLGLNNMTMYNYKGVIVSGVHQVFVPKSSKFGKTKFGDGEWIQIQNHPDAIEIHDYNEPYIWCLNTTSKTIPIDDVLFMDWDEVVQDDLEEINEMISPYSSPITSRTLHCTMESGFSGDTIIELEDGQTKKLNELEIYDELRFGGKVLGIMKISTTDVPVYEYRFSSSYEENEKIKWNTNRISRENQHELDESTDDNDDDNLDNNLDNRTNNHKNNHKNKFITIEAQDKLNRQDSSRNGVIIVGGPNIHTSDEFEGVFSTITVEEDGIYKREIKDDTKPTELYHVITENKDIGIQGIIFKEYNHSLDIFLNKDNL